MVDNTLLELLIGAGIHDTVRPPREQEEAALAGVR